MKLINFKEMPKRKKIMLIGISILLVIFIAVFIYSKSKFQPAKRPQSFNSFLKGSIHPPLNISVNHININPPAGNGLNKVSSGTVKEKVAVKKKKKSPSNKLLNDLFKLKDKKTVSQAGARIAKAQIPHPASFPGAIQPNQSYSNINNIPNVIRNIRSRVSSLNSDTHNFVVMGVSGQNAVIQYNGADLYLKPGEVFGSCFVMEIGYSSVKISCGKKAKSYPVSFGSSGENNQRNIKLNQPQKVK